MTNLYFVYGTLMRGFGNNRRFLSDAEFVTEDRTSNLYVLGDVGFPYAFPKEKVEHLLDEEYFKPVLGEVWKVENETTRKGLDYLEGEGSHYHRVKTTTESGHEVWIYEQHDPNALRYCYKCQEREGAWTWNW